MDLPAHWVGKSDELEATIQANGIDIHVDLYICVMIYRIYSA
jgi:hypothetical protein